MPGTFVDVEIASQPDLWEHASSLLPEVESRLPRDGERVAVVGCGTSWFVAQSYAALREARGQASEATAEASQAGETSGAPFDPTAAAGQRPADDEGVPPSANQ